MSVRAKHRCSDQPWSELPTRELLQMRLCDLKVCVQDSWLQEFVDRLYGELATKGLRLRPHVWASDEWASPDGVPGIQVPFYLLHPRLMSLERNQMLRVEGGTRTEAMRLLRHEAGHAFQHAYALHRRAAWRKVFGKAAPYPISYRPNPTSKNYVQHLEGWYAQSHPAEDFAETFAVWLNPRSKWRKRYAGWRALQKLEFVDALMKDLRTRRASSRSRARPFALRGLKQTLAEYYERKQAHYGRGYEDSYDRDLRRLFSADPAHAHDEPAAAFIRRHRRLFRESVGRWTGQHLFTLDHVLDEIIGRCGELKLRVVGSHRRLRLEFTIMLTAHIVHCLHSRAARPL